MPQCPLGTRHGTAAAGPVESCCFSPKPLYWLVVGSMVHALHIILCYE